MGRIRADCCAEPISARREVIKVPLIMRILLTMLVSGRLIVELAVCGLGGLHGVEGTMVM